MAYHQYQGPGVGPQQVSRDFLWQVFQRYVIAVVYVVTVIYMVSLPSCALVPLVPLVQNQICSVLKVFTKIL